MYTCIVDCSYFSTQHESNLTLPNISMPNGYKEFIWYYWWNKAFDFFQSQWSSIRERPNETIDSIFVSYWLQDAPEISFCLYRQSQNVHVPWIYHLLYNKKILPIHWISFTVLEYIKVFFNTPKIVTFI